MVILRLGVRLAAAGFFLFVAGVIFRFVWPAFTGTLVLGLNDQESIAFSPASGKEKAVTRPDQWQAASLEEIPFQRTATPDSLNPEALYNAERLPFTFQLDQILVIDRPECRESLFVQTPAGEKEYPNDPGAQIDFDGQALSIEGHEPWSGLLRHSSGQPMAAVALCPIDGSKCREPLFLYNRAWLPVDASTALSFSWFSTESEVKQAIQNNEIDKKAARWGVAEGAAIHWFEGFRPGEGVDLMNGASVTLLRQDNAHPFPEGPAPGIEVRITPPGGQPAHHWIPANQRDPKAAIRYEDFTRYPHVIRLYAWREDEALVIITLNGTPIAPQTLKAESSWTPEGFPYTLRLDQIMAAAAPVTPDVTTLRQLVLKTPQGAIRLRQGQSLTYQDGHLEYRRQCPTPVVRYALTVLNPNGVSRSMVLDPGKKLTIGDWRFCLDTAALSPETLATLHISRLRGRWVLFSGIILVLLGGTFTTVVRIIRRDAEYSA